MRAERWFTAFSGKGTHEVPEKRFFALPPGAVRSGLAWPG